IDLLARAELALDVVADLVRDDVRPREIARSAEVALHLAIERQVEVHTLIGRAVERPGLRRLLAAPRADRAVVEHELGVLVGAPGVAEGRLPGALRVGEDV